MFGAVEELLDNGGDQAAELYKLLGVPQQGRAPSRAGVSLRMTRFPAFVLASPKDGVNS